jgi:hypothetical protein
MLVGIYQTALHSSALFYGAVSNRTGQSGLTGLVDAGSACDRPGIKYERSRLRNQPGICLEAETNLKNDSLV